MHLPARLAAALARSRVMPYDADGAQRRAVPILLDAPEVRDVGTGGKQEVAVAVEAASARSQAMPIASTSTRGGSDRGSDVADVRGTW